MSNPPRLRTGEGGRVEVSANPRISQLAPCGRKSREVIAFQGLNLHFHLPVRTMNTILRNSSHSLSLLVKPFMAIVTERTAAKPDHLDLAELLSTIGALDSSVTFEPFFEG